MEKPDRYDILFSPTLPNLIEKVNDKMAGDGEWIPHGDLVFAEYGGGLHLFQSMVNKYYL
jgi:hypothetical protein